MVVISRTSGLRPVIIAVAVLAQTLPTSAGVLPNDRADALYHSYAGGGLKVNGPSVLVRKSIGSSVSVNGNYYVDHISNASIDVVTQGSPFREERTEKSLGVDYLRGPVSIDMGYINSEESDYSAHTAHFNISQDMFGDLTTVTLGYARGWDTVRDNGKPDFAEDRARQNYQVNLSQILTKNTLFGIAFEAITNEGYLHSPYRSVRYLDPSNPIGYSYEPEVYPNTRNSGAVTLSARYYLPYRAAIKAEYRIFDDSWGIRAHNAEIGYTHPFQNGLTFDLRYRVYTQTAANFYSDLFPFSNAQNFMARDREFSAFTNHTIGAGISREFGKNLWDFVDKGSLNLYYDYIQFDYNDFRDVRQRSTPGQEPLYSYSANVLRFFISIWY